MARIMSITHSSMTPEAIEELISQRVEKALAAQEANRNIGLLDENQCQNGDDNDNGNGGNRNHDNIQGNVTSSKPVRLQDAIRMANGLMDQKRHNVAQTVTMGNNEKIGYDGSAPYYVKCRLHHEGPCTIKCANGKKGHFKSDFPKLKNQNHGNKVASNDARKRDYALGGGDDNPDSNVVTGTFLLNNHYAYILFDSGADRSFVSTMFSALIDIPPTALDVSYTVELADGRITESNTIIKDCTLKLLDHPFSTDLMPVEVGSFDVIIGMDWLLRYHVVIVCDEKIVRIPYGNEIFMVRDDGSSKGSNSRLSIISYTKTQKYIQRGFHVFLAQISVKKTEDKSEEKRLEYVPIVQDFLEVFPEDLPGLPPA
ncbi:putative reverse transcriptase domain-containing protein [Tanacetum coccineum]